MRVAPRHLMVALAGAVSATGTTTTSPRIVLWIVQWYLKVPVFVNTRANVSPGAMKPESNRSSSDVTVWFVPSPFRQTTVSPSRTWIRPGAKTRAGIATSRTAVVDRLDPP